ncbi:MAG: twin-arginine translocase TatA/TatE family subunit [Mariprofundaceae bacterium]
MFGLGFPELLIILVIILVIFGAGKLPQVGEALGKGLNKFRGAMDEKAEKTETPAEPTPVVDAKIATPSQEVETKQEANAKNA